MTRIVHNDDVSGAVPPAAMEPAFAAAVQELCTVRDWLRWAASRFTEAGLAYGHGTATALDEAAFLILSSLHLPIDQLDPWLDARLTLPERQALAALLSARITTRKPASYLVGAAYIQGYRFRVDERVIVPRSYIGELICTGGLDTLMPQPPSRILDVCTGSGCLAILAALRWPDARVDAVEVSAAALDVARLNLADHGVADTVSLLLGDLLEPVAGRQYDLVLANPPYVAAAEVEAFPPEYAAEPGLAHLGGSDGLDLSRRILAGIDPLLARDGVLVMEIGTGRDILDAELGERPVLWLDTEGSEGEVLALTAIATGPGKTRRNAKRQT